MIPGGVLTEGTTCVVCEIQRDATQLHRCRCCRRMFCSDCSHVTKMGRFCSRECGDIFFYGDDEDEPSEGKDIID
jgi:hypothetical protein